MRKYLKLGNIAYNENNAVIIRKYLGIKIQNFILIHTQDNEIICICRIYVILKSKFVYGVSFYVHQNINFNLCSNFCFYCTHPRITSKKRFSSCFTQQKKEKHDFFRLNLYYHVTEKEYISEPKILMYFCTFLIIGGNVSKNLFKATLLT